MKFIGVIPARFHSTRFPGKPLQLILKKPLLQWVIEGAKQSKKISSVIVATDDDRIAELANKCGVKSVMTSSQLPTGTDRVWVAVKNEDFDVVLNIQGDEPLITGELLDQLCAPFEQEQIDMATLARVQSAEDLLSPNTAKIIVNENGEAIYFSRYPIPYSRVNARQINDFSGSLKHIGMYAYKKGFLSRFCNQAPTIIEQMEGLEQLRALYLGARIKVITVNHESWGVDTPDDIKKVEEKLRILHC